MKKKYTVTFTKKAENQLAELYNTASDKLEVTTAADAIDAILGKDPFRTSESRAGSSRIMIVPPLAVAFDVSEDDRMVKVWAVWRPK